MPEYLSPQQPGGPGEPFSLPGDASQIATEKFAKLLSAPPSRSVVPPPELLAAPPPRVLKQSPWWQRHPLWSTFIIAIILLQFVGDFAIIAHVRSSQTTLHTAPSPQLKTASNAPMRTPTQISRSSKATNSVHNTNVQQVTVYQTPTPEPTKSPTPSANGTDIHRTLVDNLDDWSKTASHSDDLAVDTNNSEHFNADTALAYRNSNLHDMIIWHLSGVNTVQILTYFWQTEAISPFSMYTSSDNKTWTQVTPAISQGPAGTEAWQGYEYTLNRLSGVNYVKIVWNNISGNSWSPQISQATLIS